MTQRYETYKDSGVQWLGEIPGHWEATRLKNVMKLLNGRAYLQPELQESGKYRILRVGNFFTNDKWYYSDMELESQKYCENGDLLFAWSASFGPYIWNDEKVIYHYHIWKVILKSLYDKRFAYYMFLAFADVKKRDVHGSTMVHLTLQDMNQSSIPLPPLPEQHSIVTYLDSKCSKIDEWINKKQKEVELLGEAKQRIIADAVTRGLNPNVKMKKTGIVWLEEVPEHWELKPIRSLMKESEEKTETGDEELLSLSQYTGITRKKDANKTGMFEAESTIGYKKVHPGQFVMNIMLAWNGSYAVSALEGIISPAYCVFDFICDCDKLYYDFLLRTKMYSSAFKTESRGIIDSRLRLYPYKFYPFYIPVPPLSEQQAIVSHITTKTTKIDSLMSAMNKEIEHLKEYKQRLISDVVTGQIKVC